MSLVFDEIIIQERNSTLWEISSSDKLFRWSAHTQACSDASQVREGLDSKKKLCIVEGSLMYHIWTNIANLYANIFSMLCDINAIVSLDLKIIASLIIIWKLLIWYDQNLYCLVNEESYLEKVKKWIEGVGGGGGGGGVTECRDGVLQKPVAHTLGKGQRWSLDCWHRKSRRGCVHREQARQPPLSHDTYNTCFYAERVLVS